MKIAIIHDDLMRRGGAEKVALSLLRAFPNADFFTLCYKPELTYEEFRDFKINTSPFQHIAFNEASMKALFYPMGIWAMKSLKLHTYDVVLISTTFCAKYIKISPKALLITYCHTPFRLAWFPETYKSITGNRFLKYLMFNLVCPNLRSIDRKYALRSNYFIANSRVTLNRIKEHYTTQTPASILNPPVDVSRFSVSNTEKQYYLLVSRFQPYKKIDLVIDAFNQFPDKKLIIVGTGLLETELKKRAERHIEFRGVVDSDDLAHLYANCKALIFPQVEDFGITPLEANASGRPVIAFGEGGIVETMVSYKSAEAPFTALFFDEQSVDSLKETIIFFETIQDQVDPHFICKNVERFSERRFIEQIRHTVNDLTKGHKEHLGLDV